MNFRMVFFWGTASAGHQVEGNNVNSDIWLLENVQPTLFKEQSGDAYNSFELWETDLDLCSNLGFSAYRFRLNRLELNLNQIGDVGVSSRPRSGV